MRSLLFILLMTAIADGQQIKVRELTTKPAGVKSLVAPEASADASITWEILEPVEKKCLISKDGRMVAFFMDGDSRVVILCDVIDWANKKHYKTKTIVNADDPDPPGPGPDPKPPTPPDPVVPPSGFAGDVYKQAKQINRPADCLKLANVFEGVSARIAAGGFATLEQAAAELSRQNDELNLDASWRTFGAWLSTEMGNRAQNLPQAREVMEQVAIGLKAASK